MPQPKLNFGPDRHKLAVKVPVWLWVDSEAPLTNTVTVRGLSVTVTATLKTTTWSIGEPKDPSEPFSKTIPFACAGAGTPGPANSEIKVKPLCGYTFTWKSTADRTRGSGTWQVSATTQWAVTWKASNGVSGVLDPPLTATNTDQLAIGEWRSSLVSPAGR